MGRVLCVTCQVRSRKERGGGSAGVSFGPGGWKRVGGESVILFVGAISGGWRSRLRAGGF